MSSFNFSTGKFKVQFYDDNETTEVNKMSGSYSDEICLRLNYILVKLVIIKFVWSFSILYT